LLSRLLPRVSTARHSLKKSVCGIGTRRRFNSGSSVPKGIGVYVSKPSFSLVFTVLFGMTAFLVPHRSLGEKPNVSRQQPLYISILVGLRIALIRTLFTAAPPLLPEKRKPPPHFAKEVHVRETGFEPATC
jgi:hypothetical protein